MTMMAAAPAASSERAADWAAWPAPTTATGRPEKSLTSRTRVTAAEATDAVDRAMPVSVRTRLAASRA